MLTCTSCSPASAAGRSSGHARLDLPRTPRAILSVAIPYRGRSFFLFATVHERHIARRIHSQTTCEIALLRRLGAVWPADAPPPLLLADRGFDKSGLLQWLLHGTTSRYGLDPAECGPARHRWRFLIRSCMKSTVRDRHGKRLQKRLKVYAGETVVHSNVTYHEKAQFRLHLVITCRQDERTGELARWDLVTNLPEEHLRQAPRLDAQRMQPEERHLDCKREYLLSGFGLHGLKRLRRDRLERLLFCVALACGFLTLLAETERDLHDQFVKKHFRLSVISFALDAVRVVPHLIPRLIKQACASVRRAPLWVGNGDS